jgi:hypothetical protein
VLLFVAWEPGAKQPTSETNHELRPGDRIIIREPAPPNPENNPPALPANSLGAATPAATYAPKAGAVDPDENRNVIQYRALILEDSSGSMAEFMSTSYKHGDPLVLGDTPIIDATMRILMSKKLVDVLARPQFMSPAGEETELSIERPRDPSGKSSDGMELSAVGYLNGNDSISTKLSFAMTKEGRRFSIQIDFPTQTGQTAILEVKPSVAEGDLKTDVNPIYIVITPKRAR